MCVGSQAHPWTARSNFMTSEDLYSQLSRNTVMRHTSSSGPSGNSIRLVSVTLHICNGPCWMSLSTWAIGLIKTMLSLSPLFFSFLYQRRPLFSLPINLTCETSCMVWFYWDPLLNSIYDGQLSIIYDFCPGKTWLMRPPSEISISWRT